MRQVLPFTGTSQRSIIAASRRWLNQNGTLLLMALPGLLVLFTFSYLPLPGIVLAFKDYKAAQGIFGSEWVGFNNFTYLFT